MQVPANGISLEVEDHGSPRGEPLVLVMGLGMQLIAWEMGLVDLLTAQGFRVIRFDNRDIGRSQAFDHLGRPRLAAEALRFALGLRVASPYSLADMADDTVALLDELGLADAHFCGASMGGMIVQHVVGRHAARVRSATLMMTTSGASGLPGPTLRVRSALMIPAPTPDPFDEDRAIDHFTRLYRLIGSRADLTRGQDLREKVRISIGRSYRPQGSARQLLAIVADRDRSPLLSGWDLPAQIIHGEADPLLPVAAARDLAAKIAGARLDIVPGMGHDLPSLLWPRFAQGIASAAGRA